MPKSKKNLNNTKNKIDVKVNPKTMVVEITKKKKTEEKHPKKSAKTDIKKFKITEQPIKNEIPILETTSTAIDDEKIEKDIIDEQKKHEKKLEEEIKTKEKSNIINLVKNVRKKSQEKEHHEQQSTDKSDYKNQIEALLFACGKAMPVDMICNLTGIDKRSVKKSLEELKKDYETRNNSLNIFEESDSWKINVREKYLHLVRKIVADTELPRSTMETLAVIAWKTPIYQSEVVKIRGNKCYDHIAELENLGFVSKDKKGRSYVLKVTDKFFNYFDIDHGNLKEILDEIKKPIMEQEKATTQATLGELEVTNITGGTENKQTEEIFSDHTKDMMGALEVIEIRKKEFDENERKNQDIFLDDFDKRISDVSKRTDDITSDMPKRNIFTQIAEQTENKEQNAENENAEPIAVIDEKDESKNNEIHSDENLKQQSASEQPAAPEHQKPKSLTKKQLEKKYKEDILRLREKMEKKKQQ